MFLLSATRQRSSTLFFFFSAGSKTFWREVGQQISYGLCVAVDGALNQLANPQETGIPTGVFQGISCPVGKAAQQSPMLVCVVHRRYPAAAPRAPNAPRKDLTVPMFDFCRH